MSACLQCTADGPGSDRVPKLVAAGLNAELATTLCLQVAAKIVLAVQATRATWEFVQVRLACIYYLDYLFIGLVSYSPAL